MNKHKQYAPSWGPPPQGQAAVSKADASQQIHYIIFQSVRRLEMGFSAQMGLKGDVYAREMLHTTARKIALGKIPSTSYVFWIYENEARSLPSKSGITGECTHCPHPSRATADRQNVF